MTSRWTDSRNPLIALDLPVDASTEALEQALAHWERAEVASDAESRAGLEAFRRYIGELRATPALAGEPRYWANWRNDARDRLSALAVCGRVLRTRPGLQARFIDRGSLAALCSALGLAVAEKQARSVLRQLGIRTGGLRRGALLALLERPVESQNTHQVDQIDRCLMDLRELLDKKSSLAHVVTDFPELQDLLLGDGIARLGAFLDQPNLYHFLALTLDPERAGSDLMDRPTAELRLLAEQVIAPQGSRTRSLHLVAQEARKWFQSDESRRRYDWIWLVESKCGPALGLLWPALQLAVRRGRVSPVAWSTLQSAAAELSAKGEGTCLLYRKHDWGRGAELRCMLRLSPHVREVPAPPPPRTPRRVRRPARRRPSALAARAAEPARPPERRRGGLLVNVLDDPRMLPPAMVMTFLIGFGGTWLVGSHLGYLLELRDRVAAYLGIH